MKIPFLALAILLTASAAQAQTKTGQFSVRAVIQASCELTTHDLDFATYNANSNNRVNTTLDVKCTKGTAVTVSLDGGTSGNPRQRTMTGQGATLGYQLYRDSGYRDPIDTTGPAWELSSHDNKGQTVHFSLYGEAPQGQSGPAGSYTDTVRVTVAN